MHHLLPYQRVRFTFKLPANPKKYIGSWNIQTQKWLKYVCYERLPASLQTMGVFALTIFWHGFETRFFLSFTTLGLLVCAGRVVSFF
jgi:hypothetical protein